ncbi:MAG: isoprenylcysteine carboxylmethyltransferase family protein [Elusimicrobia bacterium]|nr:isoprenylcysteine carboxylmethyltransferase family protein [Elusimicrobiota bacterium]
MEIDNLTIAIGNWFFKYRSYLFVPILILLVIFMGPVMPFDSMKMDYITDIFGVLVALVGFSLRVLVIGYKKPGTSGRGTVISVSEVVTDGAYLMCRNPLYFANFLIWLGFMIIWWEINFFFTIVLWFFVEYYFIIKAEESYLFLKFGVAYDNYRKSVTAFFPKIKNFRKPNRLFNWNKVLKNETNLLLLILLFPLFFEMYEDKLWGKVSFGKNIILVLIALIILVIWSIIFYKNKKSSA